MEYDPLLPMLSYTLEAENIPSFIEKLQNTWTVTPGGGRRCTVTSMLEVGVTDSMAETEHASKAADAMFTQTAAALDALKTYVESRVDSAEPCVGRSAEGL